MDLAYLGHSSFKIGNREKVVVTDPFDPEMVGLKFPKLDKVDIVTISHDHGDHNFFDVIPPGAFKISGPGEYEVGGIFIQGISSYHDDSSGRERGANTIYTINIDDIIVCHLGDLGHKLRDETKDKIGSVDILMIPVGGFYTISADVASEVAISLEPRIIIPMHFNSPKLKQESFGKLDGVENFLKKMGAERVTPIPKLVTSKEKLPETTTVIVLE